MSKKTRGGEAKIERGACAVQVALEIAHARASDIGRPLHPIETRWTVRHEFRARYSDLSRDVANTYADRVIEHIRCEIG
jgi:hypothetical protein